MLRGERLNKIQTYVEKNNYASYASLMQLLNVSKATVRRDLEYLSAESKLLLVRGGAEAAGKGLSEELPYHEKSMANHEEKSRIARCAVTHIPPNSTLIVDTGTTLVELAPLLGEIKGIHVITNDMALACELTKFSTLDVTVLGGKLRNGYYTLMGYFAEKMCRSFRADIAICSADAVSLQYGCMITNVDELPIKQAILKAADKTILLCDHHKFGHDALVCTCKLTDIDLYITGRELAPDIATRLRECGVQLELA